MGEDGLIVTATSVFQFPMSRMIVLVLVSIGLQDLEYVLGSLP